MPISQVQTEQLLKIVVGLYDATPGFEYFEQIKDLIEEGGLSVEQVASVLSRHPIFQDDVIDGQTEDQQVATIMEHFGLEFDGEGDANEKAQAYIEAARADGQDWGQIVYTGVIYLADDARRLPEFDNIAILLENRMEVSETYTVVDKLPSDSLAYLQGLITLVTEDSRLLTEKEAQDIVDEYVDGTGDILLTTGTDQLNINAGQVVIGNSETFNASDSIHGNSGTVNLFLDDSVTFSGTLNTIDIVNIDPGLSGVGDGTVVVNAQNWVNIGQLNINRTESPAAFRMDDIQGSAIPSILVNDLAPGASNTFDFDGQDLNASGKEVNIAVLEALGTVSVINDDDLSATETINLGVQDIADFESTLEDFVGDGTTTLNIAGGAADINFKITGALDAGITTLDATALLSNASLNVSESSETMAISMGDGNDTVYMGDTLFDDTLDGGAGDNVVDAELTNTATRKPTMSNFQTLSASFHGAVTFDGLKVDDLETANLRASEGRADFNNMDETFATVNVLGDLAQGVEVDYAPHQDNIVTNLAVNITGETKAIGNAGNDSGIETNANTFTLTHNGDEDVTISNGIKVDDNSSTVAVSIINNSADDLTIMQSVAGNSVIVDGNTVRDLSVQATSSGAISAPPPPLGAQGDLMREANDLQNYSVASTAASNITVGRIGVASQAVDLETVAIAAGANSNFAIGSIDAASGSDAATVDQITVGANRNSWITLHNSGIQGTGQWLDAASVNNMTVTVAEGAIVDGDAAVSAQFDYLSPILNIPSFSAPLGTINLVAIDLNRQAASSTLTVSGEGQVTGFLFRTDSFTTVDATGLTDSGLVIIHGAPELATTGFTFRGSEQNDYVSGTNGNDTLEGNDGADVLAGLGGNDVINGGEDNDALFGDVGTAAFEWTDLSGTTFVNYGTASGNDIIDGGAGNDIIVGGMNVQSSGGSLFAAEIGDVLTGGLNNDQFIFRVAENFSNDTGKSGGNPANIWQDVITDFGIGNDSIILDVNLGGVVNSAAFQIAYFDNVLSFPTFYGAAANPVEIVLRRGEYDDATGNFTPGTVQGALVDQFNDLQLLVKTNGFPYVFPGELSAGGGVAFAASNHEIGLIDAYDNLGALVGIGDIIFV